MEQSEKRIYDILVKAEWLENIAESESDLQKGVHERVLTFRTGRTQLDNGKFKLWMFSKLFREVLKSGNISADDLNQLVQLGAGFGIQEGWEKFPSPQ